MNKDKINAEKKRLWELNNKDKRKDYGRKFRRRVKFKTYKPDKYDPIGEYGVIIEGTEVGQITFHKKKKKWIFVPEAEHLEQEELEDISKKLGELRFKNVV